jgi:predicted RND superfamily exporter protein
VIELGILILFVLSTIFAVVILLTLDKYRKSVAAPQDEDNLAPAGSAKKSFIAQYVEDVFGGLSNRIKNPIPTIFLWCAVGLICLFKTTEQALIIVSLIIILWYLPALFIFGPASRMSARENEKHAADRHLKYMNSEKQAEEAMKILRAQWAKLEPEERRHQEMLHQLEVTARRNQIETEIAIDSAVSSLEYQIRHKIR